MVYYEKDVASKFLIKLPKFLPLYSTVLYYMYLIHRVENCLYK